jgi:2-polyprenyl-6-methoxyphenol hydroxylase-like FAD-dependent oxidoreductase
MSDPLDALIVGAGPVGMTMAAALHHHGLRYRLIDRSAAPTDKSKALIVWSRTLELLRPLGLAPTFLKAGMKVKGGSLYAGREHLAELVLTSDESAFGFPLMIPQSETERILSEHLQGQLSGRTANGGPRRFQLPCLRR